MGGNMAKAPLTAVLFAATLTFITALLPFTDSYRSALQAYDMPFSGYLFMILYGLLLSVVLALVFSSAKAAGMGAALPAAIPVLGFGAVGPLLEQLVFGQPTGVMAGSDTMWLMVTYLSGALMLLILGVLLMKAPEPVQRPAAKYRLHTGQLIIKLLVCPFVFCILYFICWYFLAWRGEAVRLYYTAGAGAESAGFVSDMIDLLLTNVVQVPYSLLQGLLYALLPLPLLMQMPGKRVNFVAATTLLHLCSALYWLIPSPAYPNDFRTAQLLRYLVLMLVYGAFVGFMLHTSLIREAIPQPRPGQAAGDAAQARAGRPTAQGQPGARPAQTPARRD